MVGAAILTGCVRAEPDAPGPAPEVGWLVAAPPCQASAEQIRTQADELVRTGLRDAGFRTVFVDCDGGERRRYTEDAGLSGDLDAQDEIHDVRTEPMEPVGELPDGYRSYRIDREAGHTGLLGFTVRVVPTHPLLATPAELGVAALPLGTS